MKKKLNCILLVDDDESCNEFHQLIIEKTACTEKVEVAYDGEEALAFLKSSINGVHPEPDIIFLDINMPGMNGWEFLEEYKKLEGEIKSKIVVMLTTSLNPNDKTRAEKTGCVDGFRSKFLSIKDVNEILLKHFPEYI